MSDDPVVEVRGRPRPSLETHAVVPDGIDDPAHPSGGNRYDRRVLDGLALLGWTVHEHRVAGDADLAGVLAGLPDGAVVLVDGLIGSAAAPALVPEAERLRIVVLLHMPLADALPEEPVRRAERAVLTAAAGVVTTSEWARSWVVRHHGVAAERVQVAAPGVDPAAVAQSSTSGGRLLCLGAVTPAKGHDALLAALARITELDWRCTFVGAVDLAPGFVAGLEQDARRWGIADRVRFAGPLGGPQLDAALADADLLVSASRRESYGMAVTEALARGIPVLVTEVGGHAEAVGRTADGSRPGMLVPPDDHDRLTAELLRWLGDPDSRRQLCAAAAARRTTLRPWSATTREIDAALAAALDPVDRSGRRSVSPQTATAHR